MTLILPPKSPYGWVNLPEEKTPIDQESLDDFETRIRAAEVEYFHAPVATTGARPALPNDGELIFVKSEEKIYAWSKAKKEWITPKATTLFYESHTWSVAETLTQLTGGKLPGPFIQLAEHSSAVVDVQELATVVYAELA